MRGKTFVPAALKQGPFTIQQAVDAGLTRFQLRRKTFRQLTRGMYVWVGQDAGLHTRLLALVPLLPVGAAFSGITAGLVYGFDVPRDGAHEVTLPHGEEIPRRADLRTRHARLAPDDVTQRQGVPITSPLRTVFDLARTLTMTEAVVQADIALQRGMVSKLELERCCDVHSGIPGVPQARKVVDLAEVGAQSPMESRLRMALVLRGLPRPVVQLPVRDEQGKVVAHADLGYPAARLGIEYDGSDAHRSSLVIDDRRQNTILLAGFTLLRFTSPDVRKRPDLVAAEVRAALRCS